MQQAFCEDICLQSLKILTFLDQFVFTDKVNFQSQPSVGIIIVDRYWPTENLNFYHHRAFALTT